jgi:hypothetical protein
MLWVRRAGTVGAPVTIEKEREREMEEENLENKMSAIYLDLARQQ